MAKRKRPLLADYKHVHHDPSAAWHREKHSVVNGRHLEPGTEFSVHGEGGVRFIFIEAVTTPAGKHWLSCWETEKGSAGRYRSFYPERVRTVHRLIKTRPLRNAA
jgi:hypothetical protein